MSNGTRRHIKFNVNGTTGLSFRPPLFRTQYSSRPNTTCAARRGGVTAPAEVGYGPVSPCLQCSRDKDRVTTGASLLAASITACREALLAYAPNEPHSSLEPPCAILIHTLSIRTRPDAVSQSRAACSLSPTPNHPIHPCAPFIS